MARKNSTTDIKNSSLTVIEHTAIDSSGRLASLYDAYQYSIVKQLNLPDKRKAPVAHENKPLELGDLVRCEIIHGDTDKSQNLLQMTEVQDDLRLNILLNIGPRIGIASIINHPHPINHDTRLLYFYYLNRKEQLPDKVNQAQKLFGSSSPKTNATHIITGVSWGINLVILLQLQCNADISRKIDELLHKVRGILIGNQEISSLSTEDENLLQQSTDITVYSNISDLCRMTSVTDACRYINKRSESSNMICPLTYTLETIQQVYPQYTGSDLPFIQLESTYNDNLERYLLRNLHIIKAIKHRLDYKVTRLLCGHLDEQLRQLQQRWMSLESLHEQEIQRLKTLISDIRHGRCDVTTIDEALRNKEATTLTDSINKLTQDRNDLEAKGQLISDLNQEHFQYYNVTEHEIDRMDNEVTIERKLIMDEEHDRVLCSNDLFNRNKPHQLQNLRRDLSKKFRKDSKLRLIYADFSYCSYELRDMMILSSNKQNSKENKSKQKATPSPAQAPSSSSTAETINILLLGESGVGKSTFINAFVNYLTYESLEEAQSKKPVVLIPVSFLITVGNNFEEHIIKFGDVDSLNNEDFDHPGQSVTQHCKSYVFHLDDSDGRKLRIIDTPGFGDTRGLDQDDFNMNHILEYINTLTHVNAVCFLLKPNTSRLHIFFRSCLIQLLSLFGSNLCEKIIFCFTNARSTFYTPGDTAPLLKAMLASLSSYNISIKNSNTFCFDNESFRYLVALQNKITFDALDKQEYERSWATSVTQSKRLIDYILGKLTGHSIHDEVQSIKHAQLEILHMIRPMLEAMRNILRNRILSKSHYKEFMELHPKPLRRPASICLSCKHYPNQVGNFWVVRDLPHEIQNECRSCSCPLNQHTKMNYLLNYSVSDRRLSYSENDMTDKLHRLCCASAEFAHFLIHIAGSSKDDPFFMGLVQMIVEEAYLRENQPPNRLNLLLVNELRQLQREYEDRLSAIMQNGKQNELSNIYNLINTIREYPIVREQMNAIKEGQMIMRKQYEHEVPKNLSKHLVSPANDRI